jgi:hypothetical protein
MAGTKRLKQDAQRFKANGKTYHIDAALTIERFRIFRKFEHHFGWGMDFDSDLTQMQSWGELINKGKTFELAVQLNKRIEFLQYAKEERHHPALYLCTLFIITDDEDVSQWHETLAEEKINDWNVEGYDVRDFFWLAGSLVPGFLKVLNETSRNILQEIQNQID